MTNDTDQHNWMDERIDRVPYSNWLYKWFLLKPRTKLTYNEMFVLLYGLNKKALSKDEAREFAFKQIINIYKYLNNNKLPNGITDEQR